MATIRTIALMSGATTLLALAACSRQGEGTPAGGGQPQRQDWSALKDFTAIDATGPDDVVVTTGSAWSVTAQGDAKIIDRLDIHLEGEKLSIGRRSGGGSFWGDSGDVTVRVTMPAVSAVDVTGSGDFTLDKAEGKTLDLALTGSGDMVIRSVKTQALTAEITGSGSISLAGAARESRFSVTGSGDIEADGLRSDKASVRILGSGNAGLASDGVVDINLMGSGDVTVKGKAKCNINRMGSGEAQCG
ncbi:MAG: head GIN domain-containing protein [Sphingobium sp.]